MPGSSPVPTKAKARSKSDEQRRDSQRHRRSPAYTELAELPPVREPAVYSIEQFCQAHDISYGHFYALQRAGLGPRVMKLGSRRLISVEEARRWRAERTAATGS